MTQESAMAEKLAGYNELLLTLLQKAYQAEHGGEPMPAGMEAAVNAALNMVCDVVFSLDKLARSVEMIAATLDESVSRERG